MNKEQLRLYIYYFIIGLVSLISCCFLPMLGSTVGVGFSLPTDAAGWTVWIATKVIVGIVNMLLFYCFMQQAKVNVRDDRRYIEANEILDRVNHREHAPKGPSAWQFQQYAFKGTTVFITSSLSVLAMTQAILQYDSVALLTYIFTITMGLVFGVIQMKKAELYWTDEYYSYAKKIQEELKNDHT